MKNAAPAPDRAFILSEIVSDLALVVQWAEMGHYDIAHRYQSKADALLGLLEIWACGSYGGFDTGQPNVHGNPNRRLWMRFTWVWNKFPEAQKEVDWNRQTGNRTWDELRAFYFADRTNLHYEELP